MLRWFLTIYLNLVAGGRGLFLPLGEYAPLQVKQILVLAPGEIPTVDFYLRGRLEGQLGADVRYVNMLTTVPGGLTLADDTLVVLVRHAPLRWLRWLEKRQNKLAGVAFLLDDDIPVTLQASELPLRYALKTAWRYARTRRMLGQLCSEVWVSTPELARRYADANPRLLEPGYAPPKSAEQESLVYFYHGSWAHRQEMAWLVPVIRAVQEAVPDVWFEIMGTDKVRRLFRGIPRVRVVHPMSWPDYLAYAGSVRYQVGLAPCFDTPFNRARSHSKMFDITRLGAAGIYSDISPYAEKVIHGQTGLLCANDQEAWVAAISLLLQDQGLRDNLYRQALGWCDGLSVDICGKNS